MRPKRIALLLLVGAALILSMRSLVIMPYLSLKATAETMQAVEPWYEAQLAHRPPEPWDVRGQINDAMMDANGSWLVTSMVLDVILCCIVAIALYCIVRAQPNAAHGEESTSP